MVLKIHVVVCLCLYVYTCINGFLSLFRLIGQPHLSLTLSLTKLDAHEHTMPCYSRYTLNQQYTRSTVTYLCPQQNIHPFCLLIHISSHFLSVLTEC